MEIVRSLLKHEADIDIRTLVKSPNYFYRWYFNAQSTPLRLSVVTSSLDIMCLLLKAGANAWAVDDSGFSMTDKAIAQYADRNIHISAGFSRDQQEQSQEKGLEMMKKLRLLVMAGRYSGA